MDIKQKFFYITTPIYYGTAKPHLGSLYSTVLADIIARWRRLSGDSVFFMTGTDEHGQKIAEAACKAGMEPQQFVDQFVPLYKKVWYDYDICYSHFARTTDKSHKIGAQTFVQNLIKNNAVYKDQYQGWYCTPCETFLTEKESLDGKQPLCPSCGRETSFVTEEAYFFRLSAYQQQLLDFYAQNPQFIVPKERFNEVMRFVEGGLKDLCISRTTVKWGIPFLNDESHTIYVWTEALCSYLTSVGYGSEAYQQDFNQWWPPAVQVLGKDIIKFHAVYWPAFLMAAGLALPKRLLVHGWIKINHEKMSKSKGNVIDPIELGNEYGFQEVRYYLARYIAINQDGEFSLAHLRESISADLADDLGNLVQRLCVLADKYNKNMVHPTTCWSDQSIHLRDGMLAMIDIVQNAMQDYSFHIALSHIWTFIKQINSYFHVMEPWKKAKTDMVLFEEVLSATCHSLRAVALLLWPVMPHKMESILKAIGVDISLQTAVLHELELDVWSHAFLVRKVDILFKKWEPLVVLEEQKIEQKETVDTSITIDEFIKVELCAGTIIKAETVPGSEKLLKLQVDFGKKGERQILSGIAKHFSPEAVMGKKTVFVFNLKPRKMMGMESHGMMLMASAGDTPTMLFVDDSVLNGTQLK